MNVSFLCLSFVDVLQYIFYIFIALLILMVMITIHEFGHFIVGKKLGFKINEFAIGFGKILYKRTTKSGTLFTIRLVPLGGFCAFEGEDADSEVEGSFNSMAPWKRLLVLFSGAFFNFISAIIMSFILLVSLGYADLVQVTNVEKVASETNAVQLQEGDIIYQVNGEDTNFVYDKYFITMIEEYAPGEDIPLTVKRNGEMIEIVIQKGREIVGEDITSTSKKYILSDEKFIIIDYTFSTPTVTNQAGENIQIEEKTQNDKKYFVFTYENLSYVYNIEENELFTNYLGVSLQNYKYSFVEALVYCIPFTFEWAWKILIILWMLISGQMGLESLGGPITTISSIATYTQYSWLNLLILFPLISINLAVFNWLPFPALDGARMCFVLYEWITKKPVNRKVEGYIHGIGLLVLFAFVIFIDIFHLLFY